MFFCVSSLIRPVTFLRWCKWFMLKNWIMLLLLLHHDPTPGHGIFWNAQKGLCISRFHPNNIAMHRDGTIGQFTMQVEEGHNSYPAGMEWRPNQSWTNIISVQGRSNPEPILNQSYGLICLATVRLWFTYVRTHPFTFWFSRTDPESKMPAGYVSLWKI